MIKQNINFAELRVKIVLVINRFVKKRKKSDQVKPYRFTVSNINFCSNFSIQYSTVVLIAKYYYEVIFQSLSDSNFYSC